ncbi:MAG: hypothetical protein R2756_15925 [Bacteroidales bacterium]
MVAAYRKKADIAVGNIVGSNIFNLLLIGSSLCCQSREIQQDI